MIKAETAVLHCIASGENVAGMYVIFVAQNWLSCRIFHSKHWKAKVWARRTLREMVLLPQAIPLLMHWHLNRATLGGYSPQLFVNFGLLCSKQINPALRLLTVEWHSPVWHVIISCFIIHVYGTAYNVDQGGGLQVATTWKGRLFTYYILIFLSPHHSSI